MNDYRITEGYKKTPNGVSDAIMAGLGSGNDMLCTIGFVLIVVAMLYSPVKVHILDRKKK